MSARERKAPCCARSRAVASPIPEAAPVIAMTFPVRLDMIGEAEFFLQDQLLVEDVSPWYYMDLHSDYLSLLILGVCSFCPPGARPELALLLHALWTKADRHLRPW